MNLDLSKPLELTLALGPDLFMMGCAMILMVIAAFIKDRPNAQRTTGIIALGVCAVALVLVFVYALRGYTAGSGPVAVDAFRWAVDAIVLVATIGTIALAI